MRAARTGDTGVPAARTARTMPSVTRKSLRSDRSAATHTARLRAASRHARHTSCARMTSSGGNIARIRSSASSNARRPESRTRDGDSCTRDAGAAAARRTRRPPSRFHGVGASPCALLRRRAAVRDGMAARGGDVRVWGKPFDAARGERASAE